MRGYWISNGAAQAAPVSELPAYTESDLALFAFSKTYSVDVKGPVSYQLPPFNFRNTNLSPLPWIDAYTVTGHFHDDSTYTKFINYSPEVYFPPEITGKKGMNVDVSLLIMFPKANNIVNGEIASIRCLQTSEFNGSESNTEEYWKAVNEIVNKISSEQLGESFLVKTGGSATLKQNRHYLGTAGGPSESTNREGNQTTLVAGALVNILLKTPNSFTLYPAQNPVPAAELLNTKNITLNPIRTSYNSAGFAMLPGLYYGDPLYRNPNRPYNIEGTLSRYSAARGKIIENEIVPSPSDIGTWMPFHLGWFSQTLMTIRRV